MALRRIATHRAIRILRVVLPIVVFILIAILARNYWGRLRRAPPREARAQDLPQDIAALMNGFTHSFTKGGKTLFTVKAQSVSEFKDHKAVFRDVAVTVYGREDGEASRSVRSDECSYDEQTGIIRFAKNVNAQLDEKTFARTEELTYNQHDAIIASTMPTQFEQPGVIRGTADGGLEYESNSGLLRLAGKVHIEHASGSILEGDGATFQSKQNWATVSEGAYLRFPNGWVRGKSARAELEANTYHVKSVVVDGAVTGESSTTDQAGGHRPSQWKVRSNWLQATMSPATANIDHLVMRDNVRVDKISADSTEVLTGAEVEATLDPKGRIDAAIARRNAKVEGSDRTLTADLIWTDASETLTTEGKSLLRTSDSTLEGSNFTVERSRVITQAESKLTTKDYLIQGRNFTIERGQVLTFSTPFHATVSAGERQSSADATHAEFDSKDNRLIKLVQTGHFRFTEGDRNGEAGKAVLTDAGDTIELEGSPIAKVSDPQMTLKAQRIRMNQKTNGFVAIGQVWTYSTAQTEPVIVSAERADGTEDNFDYSGHVQLWRGDAHIKADRIQGSSKDNKFRAEGNVWSKMDLFEASSQKLDYTSTGDAQTAHYTGRVRATKKDPRGAMKLNSEDLTLDINEGEVRTAHATGGIDLTQALRRGSGDDAVYDAKADTVTLTGKNAVVNDPKQGEVRGTRLLVRNGGDVAIVEGPPAGRVVSKFKVQK
jgi:LPS export ABC transporter protein LptC